MKVCIFARGMDAHRNGTYLWPFALLARDMAGRGHAVTVLTTAHPDGRPQVAREGGVETHYLARTAPEKCDARFWEASAAAFDGLHPGVRFDVALGRGGSPWGLFAHSPFVGTLPLICHEGTYPAFSPARHRAPTCRRALGTPEGGRGGTAQPADDALSAAGGPRCLRLPGAGAGAPPDALVAAAPHRVHSLRLRSRGVRRSRRAIRPERRRARGPCRPAHAVEGRRGHARRSRRLTRKMCAWRPLARSIPPTTPGCGTSPVAWAWPRGSA